MSRSSTLILTVCSWLRRDSVFLLDALPNRLGLSTKNQNSIDGAVLKKDLVGDQN